jgi:hypothetical protein
MRVIYTILAVTGWVWCLVVGAFIMVAYVRRKGRHNSSEVVGKHEEPS